MGQEIDTIEAKVLIQEDYVYIRCVLKDTQKIKEEKSKRKEVNKE